MSRAKDFLRHVWGAQPHTEGWVFLSYKDESGEWQDIPLKLHDVLFEDFNLPDPKQGDVYFCPNVFSSPHRQETFALKTNILHADLDEVDPEEIEPVPTMWWQTSPDRYQCLWFIPPGVGPNAHRKLNQKMTYHVGADKGGWSITKVLRVPGTYNHKYKGTPTVCLLSKLQWKPAYDAKKLWRQVRRVEVPVTEESLESVDIPDMTADAVMHKYKGQLPKRALALLRTRRARVGERSERLWELECLLLDAGLSPGEVVILCRSSVWNKFMGSRRELSQLKREVRKAQKHLENQHQGASAGKKSGGGMNGHTTFENELKLVPYTKFIQTPVPTELWTVEGIWSHDAHGLIAGEPKTYKSLVATDLAVAVASGTQFLGHFSVPKKGPVIIIQEENTEAMMKDRLEKISHARALTGKAQFNGNVVEYERPEELPIYLMNNQRFDLTNEDHMEWLEKMIKKIEPKLVVLDPIYLMMPGVDENSAVAMVPVLTQLLELKAKYDVGILIVHHYNKPRDGEDRRPGNRISGTNVFYRWFESALYLEKGDQPSTVVMTPDHRGAPPSGAIHLEFDMGEMGELVYNVDVEIRRGDSSTVRKMLRSLVEETPGISVTAAAEQLEINPERCKKLAERMGYEIRRGKSTGAPGRPSNRIYAA